MFEAMYLMIAFATFVVLIKKRNNRPWLRLFLNTVFIWANRFWLDNLLGWRVPSTSVLFLCYTHRKKNMQRIIEHLFY